MNFRRVLERVLNVQNSKKFQQIYQKPFPFVVLKARKTAAVIDVLQQLALFLIQPGLVKRNDSRQKGHRPNVLIVFLSHKCTNLPEFSVFDLNLFSPLVSMIQMQWRL